MQIASGTYNIIIVRAFMLPGKCVQQFAKDEDELSEIETERINCREDI